MNDSHGKQQFEISLKCLSWCCFSMNDSRGKQHFEISLKCLSWCCFSMKDSCGKQQFEISLKYLSWCCFSMNDSRGKQQFEISLKQVFQSINNLMHDTTDQTLLIQAATLKYLPTTISDVITVYNPHEFRFLHIKNAVVLFLPLRNETRHLLIIPW